MIYLELRLSWVFMICVALQPINLSNQPAKKIERKSVIPSHIVKIQKAKMVNKGKKKSVHPRCFKYHFFPKTKQV